MKSKITASIGISILFLSLVASVSAQTNDTKPGQVRRELVQQRIETKREIVQNRLDNLKDRIATKQAALKERLAAFKDKRKVQIVERISTNLNKINSNWIDHANKFLANASRILEKLEERVNNQVSQGKDATEANTAITDAKAKLASASAAVASQSAKEYTVIISTESAAKEEIRTTRNALNTDWQAIRALLRDAKQAVANAIRVAATTLGGSQ